MHGLVPPPALFLKSIGLIDIVLTIPLALDLSEVVLTRGDV